MARINCDKELYFIHIPKNAGTAFCNQFCNGKQIGHRPVIMFDDNIINKSIAIIRNPYDRLVSVYEYNKTKKVIGIGMMERMEKQNHLLWNIV